MRVDEFAVGFGPKLISKKIGETVYSIRIIPLGGFNKIAGMDPDEEKDERSFSAKPIWARYYEIDTNTPFFCGRDGIKKYSLAEIEVERRTGYSWYGYYAEKLLSTDYPAWQQKYAPDKNVIK
jgi:membrane-associated protease RseP (regulator of RpoE activity)